MKLIIDLDGPVLDLRQRSLSAYRQVAEQVGYAALSDNIAWRQMRRGASDGQLLRGAKPDEIRKFRELFDKAVEEDDCLAMCGAQKGVGEALSRLRRAGELVLVTTGTNREARQTALDRQDLSIHFTRMKRLSLDVGLRIAELKELAEGDARVVVAAACEPLVRSAQRAGFVVVGVDGGDCDADRLTRAGAQYVFADLGDLANDLDTGCERLMQAGLLPASHEVNKNPFLQPERFAGGASSGRSYRRLRR